MIFIGINVGVFVLMGLAGGFALTSVDPEVLIGFGAKQNSLISQQHQYWRLITSIFIHIGFIHLFLNNYALWIIGQEIEQIYGSARFVVLYLATGIVGSLGSYLFNPQATSAGASGAIFGLFGVMATFAFKYRKEIPKTLSRDIMRRVLPIIAINLAFGFSVKIVDNAAHIGGLLAGIALAFVVPYMRPDEKQTSSGWRAAQTICLGLIFVSFVSAFRDYNGPRLAISNLTRRAGSSVMEYSKRIQAADKVLVDSFRPTIEALDSRRVPVELTATQESIDRAIQTVTSAPKINDESEKYRNRLLDLLTQQKSIVSEAIQSMSMNRIKLLQDEDALIARHNRFVSDYSEWSEDR
jgi:membrane associated rhomboid family serine protease